MLLNELENKEHKLNRINKWLDSEFGFTVDTATPENLAEVKKELEGVKVKMSESNDFNATHNDPRYLRTIMMSDAVDIMMEMQGSQLASIDSIALKKQTPAEETQVVKENEEIEGAEILLAAQAMVDELAGMAEDIAEMQTAKLFPLVDQIKYNMSADMAANFNNSVKGALQGLLDAMTQTKDAVSDQVAGLSGQAPASDMMADPEAPAEEPLPAEEPAGEEAPLDLGDEEAGAEDSPLGREEK